MYQLTCIKATTHSRHTAVDTDRSQNAIGIVVHSARKAPDKIPADRRREVPTKSGPVQDDRTLSVRTDGGDLPVNSVCGCGCGTYPMFWTSSRPQQPAPVASE